MITRLAASLLLCLLPCLQLFSGCNRPAPDTGAGASSEEHPTLGVSVLTLTHPFFLDLIAGMEAEAEALGMDLVLTSAENDVARQQNQVADFVVQGVDAVLISPADSRAIGTAVQAANEAGIPVFTFDIAVLAPDVDIVTHVGIDNYAGGRQAAEAALEAMGGSGQIAIIDHPEVESVIQRTRGFDDRIQEAVEQGADVEIVTRLPAGGAQDRAFRVAEDILQAHPEVDVLFGINDETALGAVAAIEKAGRTGRHSVIGIGGKDEALDAVRSGALYADVVTYPRRIGSLIVQAVDRYRSGVALPAQTLIPTVLFRQGDPDVPAAPDTLHRPGAP